MNPSVFVVDDHVASAEALSEALEPQGYDCRRFATARDALEAQGPERPDVLITDLRMDGMDGIELLRSARQVAPDLPVILVTAFATLDAAVTATRAGAFAFVTKPVKLPELQVQLRNAAAQRRLARAARRAHGADDGPLILGSSQSLARALARVDRASATDLTVLITGESGTGKELLAQRLHARSRRADRDFVAVNCGAIPEGLIEGELFGSARGAFTGSTRERTGLLEAAHGGTLFLDEVGELPQGAQVSMLRFLQEGVVRRVGETRDRRVDVRVVAATHRDLKGSGFREDLYYRLNVIPIELPPLRARGDDVLVIFGHALHRACARVERAVPRLEERVVEALRCYRWPGNVRELVNLADRLSVLAPGDSVAPEDLPPEMLATAEGDGPSQLPPGDFDLKTWLEGLEERALRRALDHHAGIKARAAASLGLERNAFRYKLQKYGIDGSVADDPGADRAGDASGVAAHRRHGEG